MSFQSHDGTLIWTVTNGLWNSLAISLPSLIKETPHGIGSAQLAIGRPIAVIKIFFVRKFTTWLSSASNMIAWDITSVGRVVII